MTSWLVTTPVDGEGTFITDDYGVLALANRIIREADFVNDGEEYIIRKADYLDTKPRQPALRLIIGGRYTN